MLQALFVKPVFRGLRTVLIYTLPLKAAMWTPVPPTLRGASLGVRRSCAVQLTNSQISCWIHPDSSWVCLKIVYP